MRRLSMAIAIFVGAVNPMTGANAAEVTVVEFNSASTPPSKLKIRQAKARGLELNPEPGTPITGKLRIPEGDGPFPAIVMIHGCEGIASFQDQWAMKFNEWGYVTLQVDIFGSRNLVDVCQDVSDPRMAEYGPMDAFGALLFLQSHPKVHPGNIGAVGWARSATLSVSSKVGARQLFDHGFRAVISMYPDCTLMNSPVFADPLLIVSPGLDDWTKPERCKQLASEDDNVEILEIPGAFRGFDDSEIKERTVRSNILNRFKESAAGVTFGYDAQAHQTASDRMREFLAAHLKN